MPDDDKNPLTTLMSDPKRMHDLFIHCRKEFSSENFCCFYLIEAYKKGPRKRMANFIIDHYTKSDSDSADEYGVFTAPLNLGKGGKDTINSRNIRSKALQMSAEYVNTGTTLLEKTRRHGLFNAIKMKSDGNTKPPADLFEELRKPCLDGLIDSYYRFAADPAGQAPDGGAPLIKFIKAITIAGWVPAQLGIWN